ncbi:MAG: T9SS type A sorting domain-containing protein [Bacteroidetes bacterium]|nr:T9SS type A sorting domain-containing protein [Bacteroidota bacterium]
MKNKLTRKMVLFTALTGVYLLTAVSSFAQYKAVITGDPSGDAGMGSAYDAKNLSYMISADKKDVTFKFETYGAVSSWSNAGFVFYIDDDMNTANGTYTPACANKSMKADRYIMCMNMMGMWMSDLGTNSASSTTSISSVVSITTPDAMTVLVKIPLSKLDGDGDGKFNTIIGIVAGTTTQTIDDLPNTGHSTFDLLSTTSVGTVAYNSNEIKVYPNPATDVIKFASANNGNVNVYDLSGKRIANSIIENGNATLSTSQLASGTYFYVVSDNEGALLQKGNFAVTH